jgi:hypothetical protein
VTNIDASKSPVAVEPHPGRYEDFTLGDVVYCLAWLGVPFRVSEKDDENERIAISGQVPSSIHGGIQLDIYPQNLFMLTHNLWDQIWYWPDRCGESYNDVYDRFVHSHEHGAIVNAYYSPSIETLGMMNIPRNAESGQAYRLDLSRVDSHRQIRVHAVCAISDGGQAIESYYDGSIPPDRWLQSGPHIPIKMEMRAYRWCLNAGGLILNVDDFA